MVVGLANRNTKQNDELLHALDLPYLVKRLVVRLSRTDLVVLSFGSAVQCKHGDFRSEVDEQGM